MRVPRGIPAVLIALFGASLLNAVELKGIPSPTSPAAQSQMESAGNFDEQARKLCGGCHAFPPPDILPRAEWRNVFVRMHFIRENRLPPIGPPEKVYAAVQLPSDLEAVLPFYVSAAPERLPAPEPWPAPDASPVRFTRTTLAVPDMTETPAVSHVRLVDLDGDKTVDLLGSEMRQGVIFTARSARNATHLSVAASIPHPAHVTAADVDEDGVLDLLVGDLGEFFPADHSKGSVIWMRGLAGGKYGAFWLDGWPRVAHVDTADFNGDGKKDLAVAAFGWRKSGRVTILENRSPTSSQPDFTEHVIDRRPGGIQAIPVDLNRDGKMDVVTLLAQEHETVLAYINTGKGDFTFDQRVIYKAPHPNWGSSGIQLVDLDADGDLDVLLAHGDTFDDGIVKPYHGIQWLENRGSFPFQAHTLARMPGVHGIKAADLDGDGDLDIVAAALLAGGADIDENALPALGWLEQTKPGVFVRHTIEMGYPRHATLDIGDVDGDGDIDIVVGNFFMNQKRSDAWVDVWINATRQ